MSVSVVCLFAATSAKAHEVFLHALRTVRAFGAPDVIQLPSLEFEVHRKSSKPRVMRLQLSKRSFERGVM